MSVTGVDPEYYALFGGVLNSTNLFSNNSGGLKCKIKLLAGLFSIFEGHSPSLVNAHLLPVSSHGLPFVPVCLNLRGERLNCGYILETLGDFFLNYINTWTHLQRF
jgi:hypothetical protein